MTTSNRPSTHLSPIQPAALVDVSGGDGPSRADYAAQWTAKYLGEQDARRQLRSDLYQKAWSDDPNERARAHWDLNVLSGVRNPAAIDPPKRGFFSRLW
jgi:hypothetical protein